MPLPGGLSFKRPAAWLPEDPSPSPKRRPTGLGPEKVVGGRPAGGAALGSSGGTLGFGTGASPRAGGGGGGILRLGGGAAGGNPGTTASANPGTVAARLGSPRRPGGGSPHAMARAFSGALSRSKQLMAPRQQVSLASFLVGILCSWEVGPACNDAQVFHRTVALKQLTAPRQQFRPHSSLIFLSFFLSSPCTPITCCVAHY